MFDEKCEYYAALLLGNRRKETKISSKTFELNGEGREKGMKLVGTCWVGGNFRKSLKAFKVI